MAKLPLLSWQHVERLAVSRGFFYKHQKGSHRVYRHADGREVSFPKRRQIARGTLQGLFKPLGITRSEFEQWNQSR